MPASYSPARGTPPQRSPTAPQRAPSQLAQAAALVKTKRSPITGEAPPAPLPSADNTVLTKTSGSNAGIANGQPEGGKGRSIAEAESQSIAGLPFRDFVQPLSPDEDVVGYSGGSQQAVATALRSLGYDPGSNSPGVRNMLEAADAIEEAFVVQQAMRAKEGQPLVNAEDPHAYANFVRQIVARGSTRPMASRVARDAPAASSYLQNMIQTTGLPAGASEELQEAIRTLGTSQGLGTTLSRAYGQIYNTPEEAARGKEMSQNVQRELLRQQATPGYRPYFGKTSV